MSVATPPLRTTAGQRGQFVVLAMLGLAVAAAGFAWWWNYNRGREALEFFGPEAAQLIRTAPTVEIIVIGGAGTDADPTEVSGTIAVDGLQQPVARRIDISRAPGLLNARTSLLDDASYAQGRLQPRARSFTNVLRFSDGPREVLLAFDEDEGVLEHLSQGKSVQLAAKTANGWRAFIARHASGDLKR